MPGQFAKRIKMRILLATSLIVMAASCSTRARHNEQFARTLRELRAADVSQWPNSLLVGKMFPNGKTLPVSDQQAQRLQKILLWAEPEPVNPADSKKTISPAPRLCALSLAGQTWYFMPPTKPVGFILPAIEQEKLERIMRTEFGLE